MPYSSKSAAAIAIDRLGIAGGWASYGWLFNICQLRFTYHYGT